MLSTGTLRVLALLAVLRHPNPPPLVVIEEIENGLDPRSIHLLDLLTLEQVVLVTRDTKGHPHFHRPSDSESLQRWSQDFSPGRLYTMGKLHEAAQ